MEIVVTVADDIVRLVLHWQGGSHTELRVRKNRTGEHRLVAGSETVQLVSAWTELGARRIGVIQSLLVTCQLQDVDPYPYLVDGLQRVGQQPAKRVNELTPWVWKTLFADRPLCSDLDCNRDPSPQ